MRIASFNINNVNKRLANLLSWLEAERPDVVCLQELKCAQGAFPIEAIKGAGYGAVWRGQSSWNGVAILARGEEPVLTRRRLPGDLADDQARYIEAAVNGVLVASLYLPNGNPQPGPKFAYKLAWFDRLIAHAGELAQAGVPTVLAGDYNVVPTEADIYSGHREQMNALLQPQVRAAYQRMLEDGCWESEFLQMWVFVMLTAYLFQLTRTAAGPGSAIRAPTSQEPPGVSAARFNVSEERPCASGSPLRQGPEPGPCSLTPGPPPSWDGGLRRSRTIYRHLRALKLRRRRRRTWRS